MTEQELTKKAGAFVDGFDGLIDRNLVKSWLVHFAKTYAEAETKELEEDYAELKMIHDKFYESDAVQHKQILALNAEIKRLREGIKGAVDSMEFRGVTKGFKTEWHPSFEHGILKPLLSPAPVTEGYSIENYPKITLDQLTETDDMTMMQRLKKQIPPFHRVELVTVQCPNILQTILALPDDTSAAYIKSMIHDQLKRT